MRCARDFPRRDFGKSIYLFEWPVETIEDSLEFNAHLQGKCPARIIVRRDGRPSGIPEIVRMILWFEHIEDVRAESLSGFDNVRAGWVFFPVDLKFASGNVNTHAGLN